MKPRVYVETTVLSYLTANALMRPRIEDVCRDKGFEPPTCTPEELRPKEDA